MKIGLLGCGVVGSGVLKIVDGMQDSSFAIAKILVRTPAKITEARMTADPDEILNDAGINVIVECMGGLEPARTYVLQALQNGKSVVTSNKKMFALYEQELRTAAAEHGCALRYEACAGGGIPWIHELERIRRIDGISSVRGIMNGTTNYILSNMTASGMQFEQALAEAQAKGYAEADPTDDIDGYDVRSKTAISAMTAFGMPADPGDIPVFGIRTVQAQDLAWGKAHNRILKLIGRAEHTNGSLSACVMPVFLKNTDILAAVGSNLNAVEAVSYTLGPSMYIGQGAGSLPTAHAVVQDLLTIRDGCLCKEPEARVPVSESGRTAQYYVRTVNPDAFADITAEKADTNILLSREITLTELCTYIDKASDSSLFIAEVEK